LDIPSIEHAFVKYRLKLFLDHRVAQVGDRIGCELKFHCAENGNIPIFFTLNGERITDDGILMEFSPNMKPLYPYIGMGHEGIIVSTKVNTISLSNQTVK